MNLIHSKRTGKKLEVSFIEGKKAQFLSLWRGRHVSESLFIHLRNDTFHWSNYHNMG